MHVDSRRMEIELAALNKEKGPSAKSKQLKAEHKILCSLPVPQSSSLFVERTTTVREVS